MCFIFSRDPSCRSFLSCTKFSCSKFPYRNSLTENPLQKVSFCAFFSEKFSPLSVCSRDELQRNSPKPFNRPVGRKVNDEKANDENWRNSKSWQEYSRSSLAKRLLVLNGSLHELRCIASSGLPGRLEIGNLIRPPIALFRLLNWTDCNHLNSSWISPLKGWSSIINLWTMFHIPLQERPIALEILVML